MRSRQMDDFIAKFVSCACNRLLKIRSIVFIKYQVYCFSNLDFPEGQALN